MVHTPAPTASTLDQITLNSIVDATQQHAIFNEAIDKMLDTEISIQAARRELYPNLSTNPRMHLVAEPGIGKSASVLRSLSKRFKNVVSIGTLDQRLVLAGADPKSTITEGLAEEIATADAIVIEIHPGSARELPEYITNMLAGKAITYHRKYMPEGEVAPKHGALTVLVETSLTPEHYTELTRATHPYAPWLSTVVIDRFVTPAQAVRALEAAHRPYDEAIASLTV